MLTLRKPVVPEKPVEMNLRTVHPDPDISPAATGANLMRVVEDYGAVEEAELVSEIASLKKKLAQASLKIEYIRKLQSVVNEYKEKVETLSTLV